MKKSVKIISLLIALMLVITLASCNNADDSSDGSGTIRTGGGYVLKFGDEVMNEYDYMYVVSFIKDYLVRYQQSYLYSYTWQRYDEATLLAMPFDAEGKTFADFIGEYALDFAKQMLVVEKLCKDAGLTVTDESELDEIKQHLADLEYAYGGEDLFDIKLTGMGFTRESIERYDRFASLYQLFTDYRYGKNGVTPIAESKVKDYFFNNYIKFDEAAFAYVDSENNSYFKLEFSDEEVKSAFYKDYVKIRHVLYKTAEVSTQYSESAGGYQTVVKPYSDEKIAEIENKAKAAYDSVASGEKTVSDYSEDNEDNGSEYVFTHGKMVAEFEKAAYEMQPGEVRLVKTEYGFHLMEKLELTDADLYGTVSDDGTKINDRSEDVVLKMSQDAMMSAAEDLFAEIKSGATVEFPEEVSGFPVYSHRGEIVTEKSGATYQTLVSALGDENYALKSVAGDAIYLLKKLELSDEDLSDSIYSTIEQSFITSESVEYTESFYDEITVNAETVAKFDISKLPALDDEFFQ